MPNIAQQDYLRIAINDIEEFTASEKAEIRRAAENGVVMDVILYDPTFMSESRIISHGPQSKTVVFYDWANGEVVYASYAE